MKYPIICSAFLLIMTTNGLSQKSEELNSANLVFAVPAGREQSLSGVFKPSIGGHFYVYPTSPLQPSPLWESPPRSDAEMQERRMRQEKASKEPPRIKVSPVPTVVVRSKPYSAEEVIQEIWIGFDGNQRSQTLPSTFIYRDSAGRIRVDWPACFPGSAAISHNKVQKLSKVMDTVFDMGGISLDDCELPLQSPAIPEIIDPIAGYRYYMNNLNKVAYRFPLPPSGTHLSSNISQKPLQYESLGANIIEGVEVHGIRFSIIIDGAQTIITESWVSNELMIGIFRKTTTPIKGEIIQTLKDIRQTEPDDSLFKIPYDYEIKDSPDQSQ